MSNSQKLLELVNPTKTPKPTRSPALKNLPSLVYFPSNLPNFWKYCRVKQLLSFSLLVSLFFFPPQYFVFPKSDILRYHTISRTTFSIVGCYMQDSCTIASLIILITCWIFWGYVAVPLATRGCSVTLLSCWIRARKKQRGKAPGKLHLFPFSFSPSTALQVLQQPLS